MERRLWASRPLSVLALAAGVLGAGVGPALAAGGGHGGGGHGGGGGHVGVVHGGGWHHGYGPGFRGGYYGYPYGYGYYGFGMGFGYGYYGYPYGYGYATNYPYYGSPAYGYPPGGLYFVDPSDAPAPYTPGPGLPTPGVPGSPAPGSSAPDYPVNHEPGPASSATAASTLVSAVTPPPARSPETDIALIVRTPADAVVWVNGLKVTQTGPRREFVSHGPAPGRTYTFMVRARWSEPDGQTVDVIRRVPAQAGERRVVDFVPAPAPAAPNP